MICRNEAKAGIVHFTKIITNHKTELHLCEECAQQRENFIQIPSFPSTTCLQVLWIHAQAFETRFHKSGCGMDYYQFKRSGVWAVRML